MQFLVYGESRSWKEAPNIDFLKSFLGDLSNFALS